MRCARRALGEMNGAERGTIACAAVAAVAGLVIVIAGPGIFPRVLAGMVILQAATTVLQASAARHWRRAYESAKNSPRPDRWREN